MQGLFGIFIDAKILSQRYTKGKRNSTGLSQEHEENVAEMDCAVMHVVLSKYLRGL